MRDIFGINHVTAIAGDPQKFIDFYTSELGLNVTPIIERTYFHSVCFSEPGGVLFKTAIDPPSFHTDQKPSELGTRLSLSGWLESERKNLEKILPGLILSHPSLESGRKNNEKY